jgi:hypothetical protein
VEKMCGSRARMGIGRARGLFVGFSADRTFDRNRHWPIVACVAVHRCVGLATGTLVGNQRMRSGGE